MICRDAWQCHMLIIFCTDDWQKLDRTSSFRKSLFVSSSTSSFVLWRILDLESRDCFLVHVEYFICSFEVSITILTICFSAVLAIMSLSLLRFVNNPLSFP